MSSSETGAAAAAAGGGGGGGGGEGDQKKLWGGRFSGQTDPLMDKFNSSLPFDRRLFSVDITASQVIYRLSAPRLRRSPSLCLQDSEDNDDVIMINDVILVLTSLICFLMIFGAELRHFLYWILFAGIRGGDSPEEDLDGFGAEGHRGRPGDRQERGQTPLPPP